jgi:hypothetical protein
MLSKLLSGILICICALLLSACASQVGTDELQTTSQPTVTTAATILPNNPPATCPITRPPNVPFTAPSPFLPATLPTNYTGQFWYGTADLWTLLETDGIWSGFPDSDAGYIQNKVFWWSERFNIKKETKPKLTITGKRLDAPAPALMEADATNALADFGPAMLIGVNFPTLGCWELTGHYKDHDLSFVVWVAR